MSIISAALSRQRAPWRALIQPALYVVAFVPAGWTFYLGLTDQLGADPMRTLEQTLGLWALRFIIAGLAVTPLRRFAGINLIRYRRTLGLIAFFYAVLHLTVYLVLDQGLDLAAIWKDIVKRPYITIGMLAFLMLVPLAATSSNAMVKRLGSAAWQKLHRLVYAAAIAAAVHFVMVVKAWPPEPLIYATIVAGLLLVRLVPRRAARTGARRSRSQPSTSVSGRSPPLATSSCQRPSLSS
jgi:sulfoxide reductase heme-binding subunit YedZ